MKSRFSNPEDSHKHSLQTLESLYEYDDFMESVQDLIDMGCGSSLDLEWWATRTTRDENPIPLNIKCLGIDENKNSTIKQYKNIQYQFQNFEDPILVHKRRFDVVWCHDAFQYSINPLNTLKNWWEIMNPNGMLVLILPQSTNLEFNVQAFDQVDGVYHNWTLVSLIHSLAVSGFDCRDGFFKKNIDDPWIHAVVYKSDHAPMDPHATSWFDLSEKKLIPDSATASLNRYGYVRQRDLVLQWLDKSLESFANH